MTLRKLGLLGGAFDPPHLAHRALAAAALAQLQLDALYVLPTGQAWHKSHPLSAAAHRVAMCRLNFAGLGPVVLDEREIRRQGPSYTVDTLLELRAEQPQAEWYLVMGKDQAQVLPTWRNWQQIVELACICVADRDGLKPQDRPFEPPAHLAERFRKIELPRMDISASSIRLQVATGQAIAPLVSPAVASYIEKNSLYQDAH